MDLPLLLDIPSAIVPSRIAVVDDGAALTYEELCAAANEIGRLLLGLGLAPGMRIPIVSVNTVGYVAAVFAIAAAGAVAVPINVRVRDDDLAYLLQDTYASIVLAQSRYRELVERAMGGREVKVVDLDATVATAHGAAAELLRRPGAAEGGPAVILYTSGTTAAPKGVVLGHGALASYVMTSHDAPDGSEVGRSILAAPLYHVAGLAALLNAIYVGRPTHLLSQFDAEAWLDLVESAEITHAFLVPTMLARILDHQAFSRERLTSLRAVTYGAAPMPPNLIRRALDAFPPGIEWSGAYGQTETSSTVAVLGPDDHLLTGDEQADRLRIRRLASVGTPVAGVSVRVIDERGEGLPVGEEGEVQLRADRLMLGYLGAGEAARTSLGADGWLSTGDLGRLDEDGYLYLSGRRGDLIIRGGENVAPEEVETALLEHPAIADVAVLGVPDEEWGERLAAVVVRRDGADLDERGVFEFALGRLAAHRRPQTIVFTGELPRNAMGKLVRRELLPLVLESTPASAEP